MAELPEFRERGIAAVKLLQGAVYSEDEDAWSILLNHESDSVTSSKLFDKAREHLQTVANKVAERLMLLKQDHETAIGAKAGIENQLREERAELELLQQRRTNLPPRYASIRSQICTDLNMDANVLPFAAELMAVSSAQRNWEASAEMVLRSFALSLLVPERFYGRVRSYVENHRVTDDRGNGQKLDYICVGRPAETSGDRVDPQSLVNKLEFKPRHDLAPWVRGEVLKRFDFRCCSSVEDFNDLPRLAMTENRHVKFNSERHQKDDRSRTIDPRFFVLGWDNTEKKRLIAAHIQELDVERAAAQMSVSTLNSQIEQLESIGRAALTALEIVDFDAIDIQQHEREIAALQKEKKDLEEANNTVKVLRLRLKTLESTESTLAVQRDSLLENKGKLEAESARVKGMLQSATAAVKQARATGDFAKHEPHFAAIAESLGDAPLALDNISPRQVQWQETAGQKIAKLRQPLQELADRLVGKMASYLRDFREESPDLDASVHTLSSFLGRLEQLRREDLPRYEQKPTETRFARRFGLRDGQRHRAIRLLDETLAQELLLPFCELSLPIRTVARLNVSQATVVIVENDLNLLTLPSVTRGIGIRGEGNAVNRLEQLKWLDHNRVYYWGDIDVEGFLILARLRNIFPQLKSVLMDAATLEQHASLVIGGNGSQPNPPTNLSPAEAAVFLECINKNRRLEQESIPQSYVEQAFKFIGQ